MLKRMVTGRHFSINEKMVRNWRKQEDELRLTKKSKRAKRGQKARWPELEDKIETWVLEQSFTPRCEHNTNSTESRHHS